MSLDMDFEVQIVGLKKAVKARDSFLSKKIIGEIIQNLSNA